MVIRGDKDGCWSYVGRKASGQTLNLGEKCVRHGIVVHELLHALGLHHQQSSHDRDDYVTIHWKNIEEGEALLDYTVKKIIIFQLYFSSLLLLLSLFYSHCKILRWFHSLYVLWVNISFILITYYVFDVVVIVLMFFIKKYCWRTVMKKYNGWNGKRTFYSLTIWLCYHV